MLTRRTFIALSGAALTAPSWQWMDAPTPTLAVVARDAGPISEEVLALVESIVTGAQRLDDRQGSAAAGFVADQFACVAHLLRYAGYDASAGQRLCAALAQLAQTAGFMAYDSACDGEARCWYLTGLRAAHSAGDRAVAASILGLMSNQATTLGKTGDALHLAAAAQEAARDAPSAVRALIAARSGLAYATAGDLAGFQRAREYTLAMLERTERHCDQSPRWANYVTRTELDAIAGRSLVAMVRRVPGRRHRYLLTDAEGLLRDRAYDPTQAHRRSALRHGAWLGLAYTHSGDLDQAVIAGRNALDRLPAVTSLRCVALLRELRDDLAPHAHRDHGVHDLVTDLNRKLPAA
ncbi:hypothetical protein AB0M44_46530 [Streptosporangium subroseum]|uniref:hypothetical protein n=1 Tax=Streptosporangium subroseum TaxID=106412 RepID=UPI0034237BAD